MTSQVQLWVSYPRLSGTALSTCACTTHTHTDRTTTEVMITVVAPDACLQGYYYC